MNLYQEPIRQKNSLHCESAESVQQNLNDFSTLPVCLVYCLKKKVLKICLFQLEILSEIFLNLDFKTRIKRCAEVNSTWYSAMQDPRLYQNVIFPVSFLSIKAALN